MVATGGPDRPRVVCQQSNYNHYVEIFGGNSPLSYSLPLVLLEISFVVLIIHLIRFLLKPLGQLRIVAEVLGGIMVGPSVLGRSKKFKDILFPENSDFMVRNIGLIGFVYFLFVSGIKMDLRLVGQCGKKHIGVALSSVIFPVVVVHGLGFLLSNSIDSNLAMISVVSSTVSVTSYPSLYPVLKELNLLSSEVGRMVLSTSLIIELIGINALVTFETLRRGELDSKNGIWFIFSLFMLLVFFIVMRKVMLLILARWQGGKPIEHGMVVTIILSALVIGFVTDMFGLAVGNGPLWLGLVIPDGPGLGSLLVDKIETMAFNIFMPFSFTMVGILFDTTSATFDCHALKPLVLMVVIGSLVKIVSTVLTCLYFKMPFKDSLALSLLFTIRGQVEILLCIHWNETGVLHQSYYTMMVLLIIIINGMVTPLIRYLCDPAKPYTIRQRRTIQHSAPGADLRVMLALEDQEKVTGLISLLEASNPTTAAPLSVTALCLIELMGRSAPVFIDHDKEPEVAPKYASCLAIHNAISLYQKSRTDCVKLQCYTSITSRRAVYEDICELALFNKATLIILVHYREELQAAGVRSVNMLVLANAPCSVGIFVNKGYLAMNPISALDVFGAAGHHFVVLFLGGADAREALAYAGRMIGHPGIRVTVIRFLAYEGEGDNEMEKKLDDSIVTWFWMKNEGNERMIYREVTVENGAQTVAAIQAINEESFDLWVVGKEQGINPVLLKGLSDLTDSQAELGIIGDYVASGDFIGTASVLVIQQQILREQGLSVTTCGSRRLAKFFRN